MADAIISDRANHPVSSSELSRRWAATRAAMERDGIDVLLLRNDSNWFGGYVKYLTDVPTGDYGITVIFPRNDEMTIVEHGELGGDRQVPPEGDGMYRGVRRVLTTPFFRSVGYTRTYDAELATTALREYGGAVVGLVAPGEIPLAFGEHIKTNLADATIVDATDLLDEVKAIKSQEEQALLRATAQLQDAAMNAAFSFLQPGRREREVATVIRNVAEEHGSEAGIIAIGSGTYGDGDWTINDPHFQNRTIKRGDIVVILVEVNGPGGLYVELGRAATIGPAPPRLLDDLDLLLEAQRFNLDRLVPGADCGEIWNAHNEFLRSHGKPPEARIHCHGQGVDMVERPLVRFDEPMKIRAGMNVACHPAWMEDGAFTWICDNVIIGPDGPGELLHAIPQTIQEL